MGEIKRGRKEAMEVDQEDHYEEMPLKVMIKESRDESLRRHKSLSSEKQESSFEEVRGRRAISLKYVRMKESEVSLLSSKEYHDQHQLQTSETRGNYHHDLIMQVMLDLDEE